MPDEILIRMKEGKEFGKQRLAVASIDSEICINCGKCRYSCPTEAVLELQRDICRLCPDCTPKPKMFPEESREYAPKHACSLQCPLGTVPEGYVNMIAEGNFQAAYDLITELNPLPVTCSMICDHPCETDCKRGLLIDEPIAIRALKRFIVETVEPLPLQFKQKYDLKIAVIGGGPAGLTAAADLAAKGYRVKIFEAGSELGGMAKRAIPDFRLDKEKLKAETQRLIDAGIEVEYGVMIGRDPSIQDLLDDQYSAVLIAAGASQGVILPIPGSNAERVYDALSLMKNINGKQITTGSNEPGRRYSVGKRTIVIGGGSVAFDTARALKRLGSEVTCACLECEETLPAPVWERKELEEEGIELIVRVSPQRIITEFFTVKGVEFASVERIDKDESGSLKPVIEPDSSYILECDSVVFATGQRPNLTAIIDGGGLACDNYGRIVFDPETLATSVEKVFVAGDTIEARGSVISAMASGRKAALAIDNMLQDRKLRNRAEIKDPALAPVDEKIYPAVRLERIDPQPIPKIRFRDTFDQVEGVFDAETAVLEAKRCMKCGYSSVTTDRCIGCGLCAELCPANAITMVKE